MIGFAFLGILPGQQGNGKKLVCLFFIPLSDQSIQAFKNPTWLVFFFETAYNFLMSKKRFSYQSLLLLRIRFGENNDK